MGRIVGLGKRKGGEEERETRRVRKRRERERKENGGRRRMVVELCSMLVSSTTYLQIRMLSLSSEITPPPPPPPHHHPTTTTTTPPPPQHGTYHHHASPHMYHLVLVVQPSRDLCQAGCLLHHSNVPQLPCNHVRSHLTTTLCSEQWEVKDLLSGGTLISEVVIKVTDWVLVRTGTSLQGTHTHARERRARATIRHDAPLYLLGSSASG